MFGLYHSLISSIKALIFKRRIKGFRKTKDDKLIIDKNFDTWGINALAAFAWLGIVILWGIVVLALAFGVALLFYWFVKSSDSTGGIVTLIGAVIGVIGVIYASNIKRKDKERDRFDNSLYIIMCYLIELKRGNYKYKIYKDDLSYIFMNVPNNVLFVLRDIQDNIKNMQQKSDNIRYSKVIDKEIVFLIIYIREFYQITNAELKDDVEHEAMVEDIICNSSSVKSIKANNKKIPQKYKVMKK